MRLLIKLRSLKDCAYDTKYYSKLRGFLYGLMKESQVFNQHDSEGYKFFCYSNIFPPNDMKNRDERNLLISSPKKDFIYWLNGKIAEIKDKEKPVEIGELQFSVDKIKILNPRINKKCSLITGTPIILRIPKENYVAYGIKSNRGYEYWRPAHDFNAFVKQLNDNLIKKYGSYHKKTIENNFLFQEFEFKKETCVHRIEGGIEIPTVGSLWSFKFNNLNEMQRNILELGLDAGFGELNSSGFGFMNLVKE